MAATLESEWLVIGAGSAGCRGVDELADDATIDRWLRETVGDAAHICGTCRMGASDDPAAVVDPCGRVIGVDRLYVADASVFPAVPRANTNLPVIVAAERLADLLGDRQADVAGRAASHVV